MLTTPFMLELTKWLAIILLTAFHAVTLYRYYQMVKESKSTY